MFVRIMLVVLPSYCGGRRDKDSTQWHTFSGTVARRQKAFRTSIGPQRCMRACELLECLADTALSSLIAQTWRDIEDDLHQALPDCPPDIKKAPGATLESCHAHCRDRLVQKAMITVRNSLMT